MSTQPKIEPEKKGKLLIDYDLNSEFEKDKL